MMTQKSSRFQSLEALSTKSRNRGPRAPTSVGAPLRARENRSTPGGSMSLLLRFLVSIVITLAVTGCASIRAPLTCPKRGGPAWTEVTSEHFVLTTDAGPDEARRAVTELERTHAALAYLLQRPARPSSAKIEAVLFERKDDFLEMVAGNTSVSAYFTPRPPGEIEPRSFMVMHGEGATVETRETFQHELAHRFLHERFAHLPRWLDEGLAQYYATLQIDGDKLVIGAPGDRDFSERPYFWLSWRGNEERLQVPLHKAPKLWDLLEADRSAFYTTSETRLSSEARARSIVLYAAAWKLVHYFLNGPDAQRTARFEAFLRKAERGARTRDAFLETFGSEMPQLESAYRDYLRDEYLRRRLAPAPPAPPAASLSQRTLADAEVHLLWATLVTSAGGSSAVRRHHLDEALREAPGSPEVRFRRAAVAMNEGRHGDAQAELRPARAARPADPRFLYAELMSIFAESGAKNRASPASVRELARTASSAEQLRAASMFTDIALRDAGESLLLVERAIEKDPICWRCQATRATVLLRMRAFDEALAAVDRALVLLPEGEVPAGLTTLRATIVRQKSESNRDGRE
jgi:tetratricopeptide (TPR) repeat protein